VQTTIMSGNCLAVKASHTADSGFTAALPTVFIWPAGSNRHHCFIST